MAESLRDKVAIITGSGRGIGRGMALLFASEGAKVVVVDPGVNVDGTGTDAGPADQVVAEIKAAGGEAAPCYESVATMDGGEKIVQTALDAFGRLDIIVNNAGILRDRMIFNMSEEEWDAVIAVHLKRMTGTNPQAAGQRSAQAGVSRPPPAGGQRDPEMIAPMAAYLASDDAWNINGYMFGVAGGSVSVLHHPTAFRTLWKPAMWTVDELIDQVPQHLLAGQPNPAPPPPDLDIPGRPAKAEAAAS
jgi:NAD(P)-dependent dehydrogenase (short-subunit alcohol dehydrogenase family)